VQLWDIVDGKIVGSAEFPDSASES
jgi:hypothetical protein